MTLGRLTRTSSLSPEGTSFNSVPGTGTPMLPERLAWKWQSVASGEVSVEPQADTIGSARPTVLIESSSSASQRFCGSAAAGMEGEFHLIEETAAQFVVAAQGRDQHVETAWHVEIDRRHHAAQIGERRREQARRRLADVDIERAAIAQHQIEIVIGPEGMAPG